MPRDFIPPDDLDAILRPKKEILDELHRTGVGATPNEIYAGVVTPDEIAEAERKHAERVGNPDLLPSVPTHQVPDASDA